MKSIVKNFNDNKTKESYGLILDQYIKDHKRCRICGEPIYYYDSIFRVSKQGEIYPDKKSYLTFKEIGETKYYLSCCEDCLTKQFPEYQNKNKSRVFNMMNEITAFAFDIPSEIYLNWKNENYTRTEENYIKKFGEEEGKKRWKQYCDKQAYSNTFEYKKEKYGWDEEKFNEYNQSRAVTIENLIKRHGEEEGLEVWNNYIERQRYTCSNEYFIKEYGEKLGQEKWDNWIDNKMKQYVSKSSQELFKNLDIHLNKQYNTYFYNKNGEWVFKNNESKNYFLDYYIKELNINIEFNGDVWHCNPKKYSANDIPISFFNKKMTAQDIWRKDEKRLQDIKDGGITTIIIWEHDFNKDGMDNTIQKILERIDEIKLQNNSK